MEDLNINFTAILIATAANFFFGFVWFTFLFGKAWAKEMGFDTNTKASSAEMIKGLVLMAVGNFMMAYVFAHNNAAWSYVPGIEKLSPTASVLNAAVFTWLGFYVPVDLSTVAWEKRSWKLFGINTSYHLGMLLIAAVILMSMS